MHHHHDESCAISYREIGAEDHYEPTCPDTPQYLVIWKLGCPGCGVKLRSSVCERHAHLTLERMGDQVHGIHDLDWQEDTELSIPQHWN